MNKVQDTFSPGGSVHWQRNLYVCIFGSFTTLIAMTALLPFLPLYVEQLGVHDQAAVVYWSGIVYGATFFAAALVAPFWGRLADRYGRKLTLIRASLGMAVAMSLIGVAQDVWQLLAFRLLAGLVGGYASSSMALVAAQAPKERSGWALGMMSSGIMAGSLIGPLVGGAISPLIGIRATFLSLGALIFVAFLATAFLVREEVRPKGAGGQQPRAGWSQLPDKLPIAGMLATAFLLMFANMSIEPIITVYVAQLVPAPEVTFVAGLAMSAAALGSIFSSSLLGRLADRTGYARVITGSLLAAAVLLVPQAFVTDRWQLILLRFLMGVALGGLLPCIAAVIRHHVPMHMTSGAMGYSVSSQYVGQVLGPVAGGFVGGHLGMGSVFFGTALLMALGAAINVWLGGRMAPAQSPQAAPPRR